MILTAIGDTHGKTQELNNLLQRRITKDGDPVLMHPVFQLGDMGLGFEGVRLTQQPDTFKFIRGNHDSPEDCRKHPNYLGDYGYLPELEVFYIGGAYSIDYKWRVPRVSWWEDEQLSYAELSKAQELYEQTKPKIVLSHECPSEIGRKMLEPMLVGQRMSDAGYFSAKLDCCNSRTSQALQAMFEAWKPDVWVYGHYHINRDLEVNGTHFHCAAELSTYEI